MSPSEPGSHLAPRSWRGTTVSVHLLTWDYAVLAVERPERAPLFVARTADGLSAFLDGVENGDQAAWLDRIRSRRPRAVLRRVARSTRRRALPSVGVEHEYTVIEDGEPVDFKALIHGLGLDGICADPVDPNAYRCRWGGVVTADGIEAEIATPPTPIGPAAIVEVGQLCDAGRSFLADHLDQRYDLVGFSTHLSISAPDRGADRRAHRYCRTFAPGLMLLLDRVDSPGLLVRPRPDRLELCGDFADGARLAASLTYAVATTRALVGRPRGFRDLEVQVRLAPSRQRFGYFVAPDAFGADLYGEGRQSPLIRRTAPVTAQQQLEQTWERVRPVVEGLLASDALEAVDRVIEGPGALPVPGPQPDRD